MKLRNKKTGEVWNVWSFYDGNQTINLKYFNNDGQVNLEYSSLAGLNEDWEDYKPAEPLIKDEKIRKAVRLWAETNQSKFIRRNGNYTASDNRGLMIEFNKSWTTYMENGKQYTISELCGEEEE